MTYKVKLKHSQPYYKGWFFNRKLLFENLETEFEIEADTDTEAEIFAKKYIDQIFIDSVIISYVIYKI